MDSSESLEIWVDCAEAQMKINYILNPITCLACKRTLIDYKYDKIITYWYFEREYKLRCIEGNKIPNPNQKWVNRS
jgi:hypothetical protein